MTNKTTIAIVGDGQMGLVLADALCHQGADVRLWGPFPEHVAALQKLRTAPHRLPDFKVAPEIQITADDQELLDGAGIVLNAIPTQFIRPVWTRLAPFMNGQPIVCVAKGIEQKTILRPSQIIGDVLNMTDAEESSRLCALSGPTIAAELAKRLPATMVAASANLDLASQVQALFDVPWIRVYTLADIVGVEIAGAAKNVIALAAGMCDGLEAGDNAKSALLARGLAEIARLGAALGASTDTFFGIAGVGDLATTCFSPRGRNRRCGERLGRGDSLESILESMPDVVEGVPTARAINTLAEQHEVDMPITRAVASILFDNLAPRDAIELLMNRAAKHEAIG